MGEPKKEYQYYLTGLKGLACLLVMTGHFLDLYKYAEAFPSLPVLDRIICSRFAFLTDEGYWLYLFFVISGYLAAKSRINDPRDVLLKSIHRFFRLGFPILFSYLVIYLLYRLVGFHVLETTDLFQCEWFQAAYLEEYSLRDVFLSPFQVLLRGDVKLNPVYWVLKEMLIASVVIYALKYFYNRMSMKGRDEVCFAVLLIVTFVTLRFSTILTACLIGMMIAFYEKKKMTGSAVFALGMMVVFMELYILPPQIVAAVFFGSLLLLLPRVRCLNALLGAKPFRFLGDISWGVYSFHWPLICSVGVFALEKFSENLGLRGAYGLSFIIVLIATLTLSAAFFFSLEKLSGFLTRKTTAFVTKLLYGKHGTA